MRPKLTISLPSRLIAKALVLKAERTVKKVVKTAAPKVKAAVRDIVLAEAERGPSAERYKKDLKRADAVMEKDGKIVLTLKDPLLRAVEYGIDSFDMKARLLAKHGKPSKSGGMYVDVPFEHDAASVSPAAKKAIKKTGRLSIITPGRQFTKTLHLGDVSKRIRVKHKRGIADDMMKRGRTYVTIRRISTKSAPSSWWHPGFRGRHVIEKVTPDIRAATRRILIDTFADLGIKVKR